MPCICFNASSLAKQVQHKPDELQITTYDGSQTKTFSLLTKISESEIKRRSNETTPLNEVWVNSTDSSPESQPDCVRISPVGRGFLVSVVTKGGKTIGRQRQNYVLLKRNAVYRISTPRTVVSVDLINKHGHTVNLWNPQSPPVETEPWKQNFVNHHPPPTIQPALDTMAYINDSSGSLLSDDVNLNDNNFGDDEFPDDLGNFLSRLVGKQPEEKPFSDAWNDDDRNDLTKWCSPTKSAPWEGELLPTNSVSPTPVNIMAPKPQAVAPDPEARWAAEVGYTQPVVAPPPYVQQAPTGVVLAPPVVAPNSETRVDVKRKKLRKFAMNPKTWDISSRAAPFRVTIVSPEKWAGPIDIRFGGSMLERSELDVYPKSVIVQVPPPPIPANMQVPGTCVEVDVEVFVNDQLAFFTHFAYTCGSSTFGGSDDDDDDDEDNRDDDDMGDQKRRKKSKYSGSVRLYAAFNSLTAFQGMFNCPELQRGFCQMLQSFLECSENTRMMFVDAVVAHPASPFAFVRQALLHAYTRARAQSALDDADTYGFTLLHYVSALGLPNMVAMLLRHGANPSAIGRIVQHTPLDLVLSHSNSSWKDADCLSGLDEPGDDCLMNDASTVLSRMNLHDPSSPALVATPAPVDTEKQSGWEFEVIKQASARAKLVMALRKAGACTLSELKESRNVDPPMAKAPSFSPYLGMALPAPVAGGECLDCVGRVWRPSDRDLAGPRQQTFSEQPETETKPISSMSPSLRDREESSSQAAAGRKCLHRAKPHTILGIVQALRDRSPHTNTTEPQRPWKPKRTRRDSERVRDRTFASLSCGTITRPFRPSDRDLAGPNTSNSPTKKSMCLAPKQPARCLAFIFGSGHAVPAATTAITSQFGVPASTTILRDEEVTRQRVVNELHRLAAESGEQDRVVLYFTGNCDQEGISVQDGRLSYSEFSELLKVFTTPNICLVADAVD